MNKLIRVALMLALVVSLAAGSATALVTKRGPTPLVGLKANVTRIDQRALVWCTRNCTNTHKLENDACNALGSSFRNIRLRNQSAQTTYSTIGKCSSAAALKLTACKTQCKKSAVRM